MCVCVCVRVCDSMAVCVCGGVCIVCTAIIAIVFANTCKCYVNVLEIDIIRLYVLFILSCIYFIYFLSFCFFVLIFASFCFFSLYFSSGRCGI